MSLLLLTAGGLSVLVVAVLPTFAGQVGGFWTNGLVQWLITIPSIAITALVLAVMMRVATSKPRRFSQAVPGAISVAVLWHLLQLLGGVYVGRVVRSASEINGLFALVLGLIVLIYLASLIAVLGIEINVVHTRRLYPRALLTPFTDDVELTPADRKVYTDYAQAQRHKGFERVEVEFAPHPNGDHGDTTDPDVADDASMS
jgi:uncharacterized BrkB/YihY/UPF0761 family membrane protein